MLDFAQYNALYLFVFYILSFTCVLYYYVQFLPPKNCFFFFLFSITSTCKGTEMEISLGLKSCITCFSESKSHFLHSFAGMGDLCNFLFFIYKQQQPLDEGSLGVSINRRNTSNLTKLFKSNTEDQKFNRFGDLVSYKEFN